MTPVSVVRDETPAGRQAQCDWAAFGETQAPDGTVRKLWAFVYTLSYSRCLLTYPCGPCRCHDPDYDRCQKTRG